MYTDRHVVYVHSCFTGFMEILEHQNYISSSIICLEGRQMLAMQLIKIIFSLSLIKEAISLRLQTVFCHNKCNWMLYELSGETWISISVLTNTG